MNRRSLLRGLAGSTAVGRAMNAPGMPWDYRGLSYGVTSVYTRRLPDGAWTRQTWPVTMHAPGQYECSWVYSENPA